MKMVFIGGIMVMLGLCVVRAAEEPELKDEKSKVSYGIGMNLGNQFKQDEMDIDVDLMLAGMKDAMTGSKTRMTEAEMQAALTAMMNQTRAKRTEKRRVQGEKNRTEGEQFLAANKAKPGVVALPSGLQYKVLVEGQGETPKPTDTVTVHYRGTLLDGTEFDSSYSRGQPATFPLNRVIKGWTEGLQLMKPGGKMELYIPSDLAYGANGSGAKIAPNAALKFEVELISVQAPEPPAPASGGQPVTSDIIKVPSKEEMEKGAKVEVIKKEDVDKLIKEQQQKK